MSHVFVLAQLEAVPDPAENLARARTAAARAADTMGADLLIFPELYMCHFAYGSTLESRRRLAQPLEGPFVSSMRTIARTFGLWMVFGMLEAMPDDETHCYNTTLLVDSEGAIRSVYRKTHLFDAFGFRESDFIRPGDALTPPVQTPFGKIGLMVCYDLRFPEVARSLVLAGAEMLIVPSAWVRGDLKERHYHTLLTARAIENSVFVLSANRIGRDCIGQSLALDPMGVPLAFGTEAEGLFPCHIARERLAQTARLIPQPATSRRPELYTL